MNTNSRVREYQWVLIAAGATLFVIWELVDHLLLMRAPMRIHHGSHVVGETVMLAGVAAAVFALVARYERRLVRLNEQLEEKNEALRRLEATRDQRLLELAQDLGLSLADLVANAQVALQCTTDLPNIKTFSAAIDRAQDISAITRDLLELKQMSAEEPIRNGRDREGPRGAA